MKLKEVRKDNENEITVYSGIKDVFGGSCELWVSELLHSYRLRAKNKDYKKRCRKLKENKLSHIIPPEYLEVIDITEETENFLKWTFPGYSHTDFTIWS